MKRERDRKNKWSVATEDKLAKILQSKFKSSFTIALPIDPVPPVISITLFLKIFFIST
jgi:hypothetical protein